MQNEPGGQCKGSKARPIHFLRGFFLNVTEEAVSKILSKTTPSRETNGCDRRNWTPMHQAQLWQTLTHQNRIDFDPDSFTKSRCHALQVTGERDWDLASSWLVPWQWWQIPKNSQLYEHLLAISCNIYLLAPTPFAWTRADDHKHQGLIWLVIAQVHTPFKRQVRFLLTTSQVQTWALVTCRSLRSTSAQIAPAFPMASQTVC